MNKNETKKSHATVPLSNAANPANLSSVYDICYYKRRVFSLKVNNKPHAGCTQMCIYFQTISMEANSYLTGPPPPTSTERNERLT